MEFIHVGKILNFLTKVNESETTGLFSHYDENGMVFVKVKYSFKDKFNIVSLCSLYFIGYVKREN